MTLWFFIWTYAKKFCTDIYIPYTKAGPWLNVLALLKSTHFMFTAMNSLFNSKKGAHFKAYDPWTLKNGTDFCPVILANFRLKTKTNKKGFISAIKIVPHFKFTVNHFCHNILHNFLYFSFQVSVNEILPQWIGIITGQSKSISSFLWVFQTEGGLGRTLGKY